MTTGAASPYSTGGGGVLLEHRYAATLLAALLAEDPVGELGDDLVPQVVRLQASDVSPIDDIVVEGRTADGQLRRVSIGVRRDPELTTSDTTSVPLVHSFLRVVCDHWDEVAAGRWRVALAVGVSSTAVQQTDALARIAQSVRSPQEFREAIERPRATNHSVRARLKHLDALVTSAAKDDLALAKIPASELTWRWLSALRVRQLRLEGVDGSDRTTAISALRRTVADETVETANKVFSALAEIAGGWASSAARVNQALVRRALSGYPLNRSASYHQAWSRLDGLARRLREGTGADLAAGEVRLELDRAEERARLADVMTNAGRTGAGLVVTGEPDVGKSALTLRAAEQLAHQGAVVASLSLRDVPVSVAEVEHLLGGQSLADVLMAGDIRPTRLLVVDGAEAVLEGRRDLMRELATAAFKAGWGVVAVTRTDGARRVQEVLQTATSLAGGAGVPAEDAVARLSSGDRRKLVDSFQSLIRLSADARAEWLVGRPGLVDVLLRAGTVTEVNELLSEADVFAAVWNGLVRNHEEHTPGRASPDDREQAVLTVARRALNTPDGAAPAGGVWAQLRSDAVLRAPANPAFASGDEFATDLIRDFALCRLFLTAGWEPLRMAGAPRWTIRAVRLACQAKLLAGDRAAVWRVLRREFDQLSQSEGERWSEVPIEALLTLGDAQAAIEHVWDELAANDHQGLQTLLRLADLRYVTGSFGDPFALAPVVAVTYCSDHNLGQDDRYSQRPMGRTIRKLVLAWLGGMARDGHGANPLRRQVRDRILASKPECYDEFAVEALVMLGPDFDDRTEEWLRGVAANAPARLRPAVESTGVIFSLVQTRPRLLLDLTEAYYIDQPDSDETRGWGLRDDGIRDHRYGLGFGVPFAAWHYGPFFWLLQQLPVDTLGMINRMLDHAAATRVGPARQHRSSAFGESRNALVGIELDVPGIGSRSYVGDGHVWGWYRGSTVGPYPCMSALLAVEQFSDHLIDKLNIPPKRVVDLLLQSCNNLAMQGLVVGLLIRHLEAASDLLDPWLVSPVVWSLEFDRAAAEGRFHVRGSDPEDAVGENRRRLTPRDAAAEMTVRAIIAGDQPRLDALAEIADQLVENAQTELDNDPDDQLLVVQGWASVLRSENYHARRAPDGPVVIQYEPPVPVAEALVPSIVDFKVGSEALRLELTYFDHGEHPDGWPADTLLADISLARQIAADPPTSGPLHPEDPLAAVAAAAIVSYARGLCSIPDDDLRWAAASVLAAAVNPKFDVMSYEATTYPMAADRSAAKAVPSLLLPQFDHLGIDPVRIEEALTALATRLYHEVRTAFVAGCALVWPAPCTDTQDDTLCRRHAQLWNAVQAGLSDCRLGPWNQQGQRRLPHLLPPPYTATLPAVPTADLLVNRLSMPIACTAAARTTACLSEQTAALLPVLLDAHRTGTDHWMTEGYDGYQDSQRELVARVLINLTAAGETEPLTAHLKTFAANARALQQLLHDFAVLFTYDCQLRVLLPSVWQLVLRTTLDAIDAGADLHGNGHWSDYAVAALLPTPQLRSSDPDPDETLNRARCDWLPPDAFGELAERWLSLGSSEPKAADALAQFARTAPYPWQCTTGLTWLERIIDGHYGELANRCWFVTHWLAELREAMILDATALTRWRLIVDLLAAAGDSRAVELQRIDE
ncbi:hypothetical protein ABZZ17_25555 [Streptomyces sp. NPDC006512]|uniref:hypothetical protein n=1 Tax=Streptomyces sp. NPDC006512 TaxID=3154307 RepID=UPI0033B2CD6F